MPGALGHAWEQIVLPGRIKPGAVLWSPANTGPLTVRRQVLTIHDLSPLEHPEWFRPAFAAWYRLLVPVLAGRVERILAPSGHVRQKILARFGLDPGRVVVSGEGVDPRVFRPGARLPDETYPLPRHYVLFVGSIEPRKNLAALLRAWAELGDEFREHWLIVAGAAGPVFRRVALHPAARVRFLGHVPDSHLPGLYSGAALFVLPSLDEGFGLSALEAMACGTPVLASDGGALPELLGEAGLIFKLCDPDGLTAGLRHCLADEDLRTRLRERGLARAAAHSWAAAAELIWKLLQDGP
jgi:glycosyltransferase involved in cell wall biosynthesis